MTLVEILIVVVVIGILGSIAYPTFTQHVRQAHRQTAKADMMKIQLLLEKGYDNSHYSTVGIISGAVCLVCDSDEQRYEIDVTFSSSGYSITATPRVNFNQHLDVCEGGNYSELALGQSGEALPAECW